MEEVILIFQPERKSTLYEAIYILSDNRYRIIDIRDSTGKNENEDDENDEQKQSGSGPFANIKSQFGHHGFMRHQFGQRGWLRPAIISMLEEKPMNGMEVINRFYDVSHGWWKPSPGSVYPLLETLESEGLIKKGSDGRYSVTKKYEDQKIPQGQADELLTNMEGTISYFEDMAKSDRSKFSGYKARIEKLSSRLSKLK